MQKAIADYLGTGNSFDIPFGVFPNLEGFNASDLNFKFGNYISVGTNSNDRTATIQI